MVRNYSLVVLEHDSRRIVTTSTYNIISESGQDRADAEVLRVFAKMLQTESRYYDTRNKS